MHNLRWALAMAAVWLLLSVQAADVEVPEWFRDDPKDPYKVLDAWKHLTTPDAALYLSSGGRCMLAGVLLDELGKPLPKTLMSMGYFSGIRAYSAQFATDENGYFVIYGPYDLNVIESIAAPEAIGKGIELNAYPGYPLGEFGLEFAGNRHDQGICTAKPLLLTQERAFYVLTVKGKSNFDQQAFEQYMRDLSTKKTPPRAPWRNRPEGFRHESQEKKLAKFEYKLKVVGANGEGVKDALVMYSSHLPNLSNSQIVKTNADGECEVKEKLPAEPSGLTAEKVQRTLCIDAPGYAVGPIPSELKTDTVNVIRLEAPAVVSGTVRDHHGLPLYVDVEVVYRAPTRFAFETRAPQAEDRSFRFDSIMVGQEFKLVAERISHQCTPRPRVETDWMVLKAGEQKEGVNLTIPPASALYVVCTDAQGEPMEKAQVSLMWDDDSGGGTGGYPNYLFGGLGSKTFRVSAYSASTYRSDPIQLKPGELRVVKITLERSW